MDTIALNLGILKVCSPSAYIADSLEAAFPALRDSWFGSREGLHIDSWMAVDGVGEWKVQFSSLAPGADSPRLYFINLGGYEKRAFGEAHHYVLQVARDKREAVANGRLQMLATWSKGHTDAVLDVDDCLPIDRVDGRYVHLVHSPHLGVSQCNDYILL